MKMTKIYTDRPAVLYCSEDLGSTWNQMEVTYLWGYGGVTWKEAQ